MLSGADGAASRLGIKGTTLRSMLKRFGVALWENRRGKWDFRPGSEPANGSSSETKSKPTLRQKYPREWGRCFTVPIDCVSLTLLEGGREAGRSRCDCRRLSWSRQRPWR